MTTSTTRDRAIAKARLLAEVLAALSRCSSSPLTHAVAAHLVADAWMQGSYWIARTPMLTLAHRLGVHKGTIKRAIRELESFEVLRRRSGAGQRRSIYVLQGCASAPTEGAPAHPYKRSEGAPAHLQGSASAPFEGAPEAHLSELTDQSADRGASPGIVQLLAWAAEGRSSIRQEHSNVRPSPAES